MHPAKPSLYDTLYAIAPAGGGGPRDPLDGFDAAEAADEFEPLPRGVYTALAVGGKLTVSSHGTPYYKVAYRITQGDHAGRRVWGRYYLTADAMAYSKRDLMKFGLDTLLKLKSPFPSERFVCRLQVVLRRDDDGLERNDIRDVQVVGLQEPPADPFAPAADAEGGEK
jgi:hypothetical protein